ncbi:hypothetical protein [Pseudonocardia asaccharolytica]|uniref:DUF559 domain-containing protein n=1 Tax=Pseudonocardia asaccharolytica DSM 44247 = NBRC 16224 TaxID=1123024 RepID=A0A511D0I4_9PSEU|nr:hypothetical protein [Pseudonocardia asaccharolytica]GEL18276.1 hypothetical protein PA7_21130 [Pseudonocardia asaccharolytica DSM 44247 = NBRC 16224]
MDLSSIPVFRGSDAIAEGLLTVGQLRGPWFRPLFRNVYTTADRDVTHELRCRAATLALPRGAVVTGRSAATVRGVRLCWPDDDVQVVAPLEMRLARRTGLRIRRTELAPGESRDWAHGRLASPLRTVLDLLLARPLHDAVADLDAVLRADLVELSDVATMVDARSDNGIRGARRAVQLADPRAESLPESKLRVLLVLDGLQPVPQYWICDRGVKIARTDLAFPAQKVSVEYDGDWRDGEMWALNRDRDRLNRVHDAGWTVVFVTAPLLRDKEQLIATVRSALARRS